MQEDGLGQSVCVCACSGADSYSDLAWVHIVDYHSGNIPCGSNMAVLTFFLYMTVWEMFYCESAYEGLMEAQICVGVCDGSLRPHFNETCPLPYQKLARQCWAQEPEDRYDILSLIPQTPFSAQE